MRAIDAGRRAVTTVSQAASIAEVARLMAAEGLRAVIVTGDDGSPVGIVSERDLVVRALARCRPPETPVASVMTPDLVTAPAGAPTRFVYRLLQAHRIRQVPLIDRGRLVGTVSRDDLADEADAEVIAGVRGCPRCHGEALRPVSTEHDTNFLCSTCGTCWHLRGGVLVQVEQRTCPGCPEHNFCRFPLIDYGVDPARLVTG